jgi:hypothetical protein
MVPHERTRSQFCCGLGPNGYRSASRSIPTSTARSVRSSSQSDQQLGEGSRLGVPPVAADPIGAVEVGEHEDVEQLGATGRPEGVEALT